MASDHYLTAQEAATALGVSLPTLYAYVSRGLIRSEAVGKTRTRRYHLEDILVLQERREQRKNPQKIVEGALNLGAPLMESALTLIADGRLYYRGRDVLELAQTHTAEQVAWLLWTGQVAASEQFTTAPVLAPRVRAARHAVAGLTPVEAFQALLPLAAVDDLAAYDLRPAAVAQSGMRILRLLAALAVGARPSAANVAATLQRGWVPDDEPARAGLNTALILCADHEFNVSTFTARCVASAGSPPYAVVSAGLAALQGTRHGGHTVRVEALFDEVREPQRAREAIADRLRRGEGLPGFGQQLYPAGDPRGMALVRLATDLRPQSREVELASAVMAVALEVVGERPTVDFGLAMLARALRLPPGAALALFAIGRSIGWIGHAIEQYQQDRIIRPRARYTGEPPRSP
jgi:citrate synthase